MCKLLLVFFITFFISLPLFAQSIDTAWVRRYNSPSNSLDWANDVAVDDSGNVYVTGTGSWQYLTTIKYYANGDTAWVRSHYYANGAWGRAIAVDHFGNVYVTGEAHRIYWQESITIKYYPDGDTAWLRIYYSPANRGDFSYAIALDDSGNVYVTGYTYSSQAIADYLTIKYYSNGDTAWVRTYDCSENLNDYAMDIAVDDSGNVYLTGGSYGDGTGEDYLTIKYYPDGDSAWTRRFSGAGNSFDIARAIAVNGSGNVYVTGQSPETSDSIPFASAVGYQAGDGPAGIFCADLDGDSALDIAVANRPSGTVSIFMNNGDGTFQAKVDYAVGQWPYTVYCADLDGDTDLDLAVPNLLNDDDVTVYKNNGSGVFQDRVDWSTGDGPLSVFCADLDGDTDLDIVTANSHSGNVSILKNNGNATFQTKVDYPVAGQAGYLFCADLDGDLDLDLAVTDVDSSRVSILMNNGDGTFQTKVDYATGARPYRLYGADLDGDRDLDLAVPNYWSNTVTVLKNNGDGTFQSKVDYPTAAGPTSVFCSDIDGDLDLDLVTANYSGHTLSILKNNGDGTFQTKVDYAAGIGPWSVFCADLDGDSDLDLAVSDWEGDSVLVLKNLSDQLATVAEMDYVTIKYYPNGGTAWVKRYDGPEGLSDEAYAIAVDGSGNVCVTGKVNQSEDDDIASISLDNSTDVYGETNFKITQYLYGDYGTVKYYPNGDTAWARIYDGPGNYSDAPADLALDNSGNVYVTGYSSQLSSYPSNLDYATIKYDSDGTQAWVKRYNGTADDDDQAQAVAVDGSGNVYVTGYSFGDGTDKDYATVKYVQFLRGNTNGDDKVSVSDIVYLISYLFKFGSAPDPIQSGDANCDGKVSLSDIVYLIAYLFKQGAPPCI